MLQFSPKLDICSSNPQVLEIILSSLQLIGIALFTRSSLSASAVPMWLKRFSKNINTNLLLFLYLQPFCVLLSTIFNMATSSRLDFFTLPLHLSPLQVRAFNSPPCYNLFKWKSREENLMLLPHDHLSNIQVQLLCITKFFIFQVNFSESGYSSIIIP